MRTTIIKAALGIAIALNAFLAGAQGVGELRFGNERTDTYASQNSSTPEQPSTPTTADAPPSSHTSS